MRIEPLLGFADVAFIGQTEECGFADRELLVPMATYGAETVLQVCPLFVILIVFLSTAAQQSLAGLKFSSGTGTGAGSGLTAWAREELIALMRDKLLASNDPILTYFRLSTLTMRGA